MTRRHGPEAFSEPGEAVCFLDRLWMRSRVKPRAFMANRAFLRAYALALMDTPTWRFLENAPPFSDPATWKLRFLGIPIFLAPSKESDPPRAWKLRRLL